MIHYDSHHWRTLVQLSGSVFPIAVPWALLSAVLAGVLKYLELQGLVTEKAAISNSAAYSGFTFTLGFVLVFRTSQCYNRFANCAFHMAEFRSQFLEAASTLCSFSTMSKKPEEEVKEFKHKIVRLFSLIHASSLEAIAELEDKRFPILDVEGVALQHLKALEKCDSRCKVELTYHWICNLIVQHIDDGLLNCPAPILSRAFQLLERGIISYKHVLHYKDVPFPFPYAQVAVTLIIIYMIATPVVLMQWTQHWLIAALYAFISAFCLLCIEFIATELENPFGDDANDLPAHEFQAAMNDDLLMLLSPTFYMKFTLVPEAKRTFKELVGKGHCERRLSFQEWCARSGSLAQFRDDLLDELPDDSQAASEADPKEAAPVGLVANPNHMAKPPDALFGEDAYEDAMPTTQIPVSISDGRSIRQEQRHGSRDHGPREGMSGSDTPQSIRHRQHFPVEDGDLNANMRALEKPSADTCQHRCALPPAAGASALSTAQVMAGPTRTRSSSSWADLRIPASNAAPLMDATGRMTTEGTVASAQEPRLPNSDWEAKLWCDVEGGVGDRGLAPVRAPSVSGPLPHGNHKD